MQAKDIMTKEVITLTPQSTVFEAIDLLVNNKISGVPVINEGREVVGVVSEKDLLVSLDFLGEEKAADTPIKEFMTEKVITFTEDTDVKHIMQELVRRNVKRVPIARDNKLIGIVSRRDILRCLRQAK